MKSIVALNVLVLLSTTPLAAQSVRDDSINTFIRTVELATAKFHDRAVAMRAGYRRVGPDFPGMGEHWVQPGRLVSGRFQADAPPILTYVTIADRVVLAGAAFALPLAPGDAPPDFPARALWHDHSASVDEESLLIAPAAAHAHGATSGAPRPHLAMLHVWFGMPNPDGIFAQENWAMPYARLGVRAPPRIDVSAARALSFLAGGDAYYRELFRAAAPLSTEEADGLDRLTRELRADVEQWIAAQPEGWSLTTSSTEYLAARWRELWHRIEQTVSTATWQRLAPFMPPHH